MIEPLEPAVVHQLRASLHITSLLQCLKELVYNALDAEASLIEVHVDAKNYSIRVDDDGTGISPDTLGYLAQPYVTTRCHVLQDLDTVSTFGYRGQALANLADLGVLQIVSRRGCETAEAIWKDGKLVEKSTSSRRQQGTTVIVRDLFYKFPARRRVLNLSDRAIKQFIMTVALAFPHIGFVVFERDTRVLSTKRSSSDLGLLRQVFGQSFTQNIRPFEYYQDAIRLRALFGTVAYPSKIYQYIFINRHYIPPNQVYKVVSDIFVTSSIISQEQFPSRNIKKGKHVIDKHPAFIIHIDDPSLSTYDITLYRDAIPEHRQLDTRLQALVRELTANFLRTYGYISGISYQRSARRYNTCSVAPTYGKRTREETSPSLNTGPSSYEANNPEPNPSEPEPHVDRSRLRSKLTTSSRSPTPDLLKLPLRVTKGDLKDAVVIGQVDYKFIAIKIQEKLLLVDQHAADERVQLERMFWSLKDHVDMMQLEPAIPIDLSVDEQELAEQYKDHLHHWGIYLSYSPTPSTFAQSNLAPAATMLKSPPHFATSSKEVHRVTRGRSSIFVTRLPRVIADRCIVNPELLNGMICEYVHWLDQADGAHQDPESESFSFLRTCPPAMMAMMRSKACRGAIMFNDQLTFDQCCWLIDALSECRFPFQCVHGRPSMAPIADLTHCSNQRDRPIHWDKFYL